MKIFETLQGTGLPCAYSHFRKPVTPPYLVYLGNGQDEVEADNTFYYKQNRYTVEFYFEEKNEALETTIEQALLDSGFLFTKSDDVFIEKDGIFVIYYYV